METITAIVHVPRVTDSEKSQDTDHLSPFHAFMNALLGSQPPKATSMSGAAEWSGAPMEALIAQGLWPIMMRIASNLGTDLSAEKNVLGKVAPKTEFLINIGLTLRYSSPEEEAAESFRSMLSGAKFSAVSKGVNSFASTFQPTIAAFFASILKDLQKIRGILGQKAKTLQSQNQVAPKIIFLPACSQFMGLVPLMGLARLHRMMGYDYEKNHLDSRDISYLRQLGDAFMVYREALKAAHLLPVRMKDFSKINLDIRESSDPYIIIEHWLRSAILLASADAPAEQGSIGSEDLLHMLVRARELEDEDLANKTYARFANRGSKQATWPATQADFIARWIHEGIRYLRKNSHEWIMNQSLVHYDFSKPIFAVKEMSPENALAYATSSSRELPKIIHDDRRLDAAIAKALPWGKITLNNFKIMLTFRNLSAESLASGITKLDRKIQPQAVADWISECRMHEHEPVQDAPEAPDILKDDPGLDLDTPEAIAILRQAGLLPKDFLAKLRSEDSMPKNPSKDQIIEALLEAGANNPGDDQILYALNLMSIAEKKTLRGVMEEPKHRHQILGLIQQHYSDPLRLTHFGGTDKAHKSFWKKLGLPLLLQICLALDIRMRSAEYNLPEEKLRETPADEINLPWSEFWRQAEEDTGVYFPIKVDPLLVKSLMKEQTFSEESIFRWAYAGEPDTEEKLKSYLHARDRYYKIVSKK